MGVGGWTRIRIGRNLGGARMNWMNNIKVAYKILIQDPGSIEGERRWL